MDANITIITIVYIIFLIVPGVFFKRFYFQGPFNKQFGSGQFADRLVTSLWWGLVVQIFTFIILSNTFKIEYNYVLDFISSSHRQLSNNEFPQLSKYLLLNTLYYFLASVIAAILLGHFCHKGIRLFRVDVKNPVWRFSNKWHYYFTGEILKTNEFKSTESNSRKITATLVDVVTNNGEGETKLFSGNLAQYSLCPQGNLDTLFLTGASRYSSKKSPPGYKVIPGDCFVIPFKNVLNINVQYVYDTQAEEKIRKKLQKIDKAIEIILFLLLPLIFFVPWFADAKIIDKILGIFFLFLGWSFLIALYSNFATKNPALNKKAMIVTTVFTILFFGLALYFLNVILI